MPSNAGQVLLAFTKANGINTDKFNTCRRVSCRDFVQRIRRSKQKINKKVSVPTPRSVMKTRREIQGKLGRKNSIYVRELLPKQLQPIKLIPQAILLPRISRCMDA